jgi:hypothetical protein
LASRISLVLEACPSKSQVVGSPDAIHMSV